MKSAPKVGIAPLSYGLEHGANTYLWRLTGALEPPLAPAGVPIPAAGAMTVFPENLLLR